MVVRLSPVSPTLGETMQHAKKQKSRTRVLFFASLAPLSDAYTPVVSESSTRARSETGQNYVMGDFLNRSEFKNLDQNHVLGMKPLVVSYRARALLRARNKDRFVCTSVRILLTWHDVSRTTIRVYPNGSLDTHAW